MARTLKSDRLLFVVTLMLVGMSVVMVYSASAVQAVNRMGSTPTLFLYRQLMWALIGFSVMLVAMRIDYHELRRPRVVGTFVVLTALSLVAVLFMPEINGARRWLTVSFVRFQPSELAKLVAVLFTAVVIERRMHRFDNVIYATGPVALVSVLFVGLIIIEPDLGTSVVLAAVVGAMLFAGGLPWRHVVVAGAAVIPALALAVLVAPYRFERFKGFLSDEPVHQLKQSFVAIGSGGVFGLGLTQGVQKLFYLPEAHSDFIFAVIAEELGLVGTTLTLACFLLIGWRGIRAAVLAPDRFGSLLAVGITTMIVLQALINVTVVTGLAPTKGLPLPFVSSGGSSLVINLMAMGILLNISQRASVTAATASGSSARWIVGAEA